MKKNGTCQMEIARCFCSFRIFGSFFLVIVSCFLYLIDSWRDVIHNYYGVYSVISVVGQMINFDRFKSLILLSAAFVYSGSFCDDWKNKYYYFISTRTTRKKYVFTKVFVNGFAVFL